MVYSRRTVASPLRSPTDSIARRPHPNSIARSPARSRCYPFDCYITTDWMTRVVARALDSIARMPLLLQLLHACSLNHSLIYSRRPFLAIAPDCRGQFVMGSYLDPWTNRQGKSITKNIEYDPLLLKFRLRHRDFVCPDNLVLINLIPTYNLCVHSPSQPARL